MNPPAALVLAFVARLDRVLKHMRAELRPGDVLVYRAPQWTSIPGELAPLPPDEQRYTLEPGRMPVPLTVAEALATVTAAREDLAAAFAVELANAVFVLVPEPLQAGALEDPAVLAAWPVRVAGSPGGGWRADVSPAGPVEALSHLLERVPTLPGEPEADPVRPGTVRATLPAVAAWALPAHSDGVYLPPPTRGGVTTVYDPPPRVPAVGLTALYRHLWARSPLFAAVEAGRLVRELTAAGDPGPAYMAAVRDALGSYARPVEGDPDALAAAALEDTPAARARLSGYAVYLLDAARKVAALFAVDPVDDDAARETAETSNGPALRWDVDFAALLTARGDLVRERAAERWAAVYGPQVPIPDTPRPAPGSLWALWAADVDGPPLWLRVLARDLWVSEWNGTAEEDRERERRRGMYSGVPGVLTLAANRALTATFDAARTGELQGEQLVLFAPGRRGELARIELARIDIRIHARLVALLAEAPPAVDALFTLALHRGFERWREMPRDGLGDGELLIDGGKRGLAALLGCGDKDTDYALTWGQCLTLPDIDVKGLWTWNGTYRPAAPGRAAVGMLSIQRALLPGAEQEQTGKGRYFAPWTEEPPLPADRSQRRAALHFWRLLGVRMAELAADGKPPVLPVAVVEHAARQAGETRWQARGDEWSAAGALALAADGWRYGPLYDAERKLLEGNQKVQKSAAKGGRARAANAERGREGVFSPRRKRPK